MATAKTDAEAPPDPDVLNEDEAADLLRVSRTHLVALRQAGKAPPHRLLGTLPRYSRRAVLAWLAHEDTDA